MSIIFSGSEYKTPENVKRSILGILFFGWRWIFYLKYIVILFKISFKCRIGLVKENSILVTSFEIIDLVESFGGKLFIEGLDILRNLKEPVVFISNHMSTLETQLMPAIIGYFQPVGFVVKESLVKGAVFGPIMKNANPIPVTRKNPREDLHTVITMGHEFLSKRISIVIFPQSTRTVEFKREEFNTLGVKLASKAKVKCVPIAIKTDFWGNGKFIRGFGKIDPKKIIHIKIGEPILIDGPGKKENEAIADFIENNLQIWK